MPSKKDRIIALVEEQGPISGEAIYRATKEDRGFVRRAIADEGGMMKDAGDDDFYVVPESPQARDDYMNQGYVPIKIRGR